MSMLLDYNQTIIAVTTQVQKNFPKEERDVDAVRGYFINSLRYYRENFSREYGEVVLCCDSRHSWRKDVFPYYKAHRTHTNDGYVDWELAFEAMSTIADEIDAHFPYRVIQVEGAEGDDIIATLCLHFNEKEDKEDILILSSDNDFRQLQILDGVYQWSYRIQDWITDSRPDIYLQRKILKGDPKDGVPNVLSPDDTFVMKKRQKPLQEKRVEKLLEEDVEESNNVDESIKRNYQRNKKVLDLLHEIPVSLQDLIIDTYHNAHVAKRDQLLNYFMQHQLRGALDSIQIF